VRGLLIAPLITTAAPAAALEAGDHEIALGARRYLAHVPVRLEARPASGGVRDYLPRILGEGSAVIDANEEMWRFFRRHRLQ
jgi:poly(3-hydroxybutyrate) depolymerase